MRPISKTILAVAALVVGGLTNTYAGEDLALPPLPAPPAASGGGDLLPAVPTSDSGTALPPAPGLPSAPSALPPAPSALPPAPTTLPADSSLPAAPATPTLPGTAATTDTFSTPLAPTPVSGGTAGRINGGRVNIRAGNSTKYEIILTANPDTPVTVLEKKGEWITIAYPETEFCYVNRQYIDGDIPADIPEQGIVRTIRGDNINIRARPWPGSTVVGQLSSGDTVIVTQLRGQQWAKIRPPATAKAYVFNKYVSYDKSGVKETAAPITAPGVRSATEYKEDVKIAVEDVKKQLQNEGKTDPILITIRKQAEEEKKLRESQRKSTEKLVDSIDAQLDRIEQESQVQIKQIYEERNQQKTAEQRQLTAIEEGYVPPSPPGTMGGRASGWIEYVGFIGGRPAGFKLVKGGVTQYLLRSSRYDLNKFIGKRILVSGAVTPAPSWEADVLTVDTLSIFGKPQEPVERIQIRTPAPAEDVTINVAPPANGNTVIDITGLPANQR